MNTRAHFNSTVEVAPQPPVSCSSSSSNQQQGPTTTRTSTSAKVAGRSAAFTLLEIMVALSLVAIVIGAFYTTWKSIMKGSKVALDAAAAAQRARITMHTLHDSILCACMFQANQNWYSFNVDGKSSNPSLDFTARLPDSFPRSGKFGGLDVRHLYYSVRVGEDGKKELILQQAPMLMDLDQDEKEHPLILAKNVDKFIVEFLNPQTGDWDTEWATTNQLPRVVRIQLTLGKLDQFSDQVQEAMVSAVVLPSQSIPVIYQMPGGMGAAPNPNGANPPANNNNPGGVTTPPVTSPTL